jgi:hypothetical protein
MNSWSVLWLLSVPFHVHIYKITTTIIIIIIIIIGKATLYEPQPSLEVSHL